jgi:peptidoglycan/LPS O-acetylase OafA/YrhL
MCAYAFICLSHPKMLGASPHVANMQRAAIRPLRREGRVILVKRGRLDCADGLRGVGAVQVCLLHLSLVLGVAAPYGPELTIFDGQLAVFIFFFISGFVLASAYSETHLTVGGLAGGRAVRLFLPSVASCFFAFVVWLILLQISPQDVGSLPRSGLEPSVVKSFLINTLFVTPILGHQESSLLIYAPWIGNFIKTHTLFVNPVLWTISVEFQGSLIVIFLAKIRHRLPSAIFAVVLISMIVLLLRSLFLPFAVGYLLFHFRPSFRSAAADWIALAMLIWAFLISIDASNGIYLAWAQKITSIDFIVPAQSAFSVQKCAAGLIIFLAMLISSRGQRVLSAKPFRFLGRISFPLYLAHFPLRSVIPAVISSRYLANLRPLEADAGAVFVYLVLLSVAIAAFVWIDDRSVDLSKSAARWISGVGRGIRPTAEPAVIE